MSDIKPEPTPEKIAETVGPHIWDESKQAWVPWHGTVTPNKWIPSPAVRQWIFGVLAAAGPLVAFYGLATNEEIALWLGVGATILGTPGTALAARNVGSVK